MSNQRTRRITVPLTPDALDQLGRKSSRRGQHPVDYAADELEKILLIPEDEQDTSVADEIFIEATNAEHKERTRNQLQKIALRCIHSGDEMEFNRFEKLCERADVSVDDVMSEVSSYAATMPLLSVTTDTVLLTMRWLDSFMTDNGNQVSAVSVFRTAKIKGFSNYALKEAKVNLGIHSKRMANNWIWTREVADSVTPLH